MGSPDDCAHSGFLSLPTELRCHIYDYLLADSHAITITAAYITIFGNRIQDRARKTEVPGLPLDLAPLVRCHHDTSLLSVANPPTVAIDDGWMGHVENGKLPYPAPLALLQTCRLVNDELTDYKRGRRRIARAQSSDGSAPTQNVEDDKEGLSLYVTYPYGVLVLKNQYPFLLKQARRVYISGYYTSPQDAEPGSPVSPVSAEASDEERLTPSSSFAAAESFGTPTPVRSFGRRNSLNSLWARTSNSSLIQSNNTTTSRPRLRLDPPLQRQTRRASQTTAAFPPLSPTTANLAPAALAHLVRTLLPPEPTQLTKLSARILYPGENSYTSVWADDKSPVTHILRSICGGKIDMQVKRGSLGTGLCLSARPNPEARVVSTSWENWRPSGTVGHRGASRMMGRMGLKDLDQFLMGEVEK